MLLTALSWLMTYQLCDASQDSAEDVATCLQIVSVHSESWTTPAVPDDDPDVNIPTLINHTLMPHSIIGDIALPALRYSPQRLPLHSMIVRNVPTQTLSPPGFWCGLPSDILRPVPQASVPSAQSLAPPAA